MRLLLRVLRVRMGLLLCLLLGHADTCSRTAVDASRLAEFRHASHEVRPLAVDGRRGRRRRRGRRLGRLGRRWLRCRGDRRCSRSLVLQQLELVHDRLDTLKADGC
jgi:hypothetical protein